MSPLRNSSDKDLDADGNEETQYLLSEEARRKRKRVSNRNSARKSRYRQVVYIDELKKSIERLTKENCTLRRLNENLKEQVNLLQRLLDETNRANIASLVAPSRLDLNPVLIHSVEGHSTALVPHAAPQEPPLGFPPLQRSSNFLLPTPYNAASNASNQGTPGWQDPFSGPPSLG